MRRSLAGFWAMALAVLAAGCGTMPNRADPARLDAARLEGKGVVILSAGAPERCTGLATQLRIMPFNRGYWWPFEKGLLQVDGFMTKSDFPDHQGNLHAVALEPGDYYLAPWY